MKRLINQFLLVVLLILVTTSWAAQPGIQLIGSLGDVETLDVRSNRRGDTVVSVYNHRLSTGQLYVKLAGQEKINLIYENPALGIPFGVNILVGELSIGEKTVYFTTLDASRKGKTSWQIPLTGGTPTKLAEVGSDITFRLSAIGFQPIVRKLDIVSAAIEDEKGVKQFYLSPTGYLGFFALQADGTFKETLTTGTNQYISSFYGARFTETSVDFILSPGTQSKLTTYNLSTKNQKVWVEIGSTLGLEGVQSWIPSMAWWKNTSFRYKTANGARVAEIVNGQVSILYRTNQAILDHSSNLSRMFVAQGNELLAVDDFGATAITSVGDVVAGKTIRSITKTSGYGCSVDFVANTDTTQYGSPHLFTTALPCVLTPPPTSVVGWTELTLKGMNFSAGNPARVEVEIGGTIAQATVISDSELKFTVPNSKCVSCAIRVFTNHPTGRVPSNFFYITVEGTTPKAVIEKVTTATGTSGAVAPNGLFTIWGQNLSPVVSTPQNYYNPGVTVATRLPLPRLLGGARVLVNGAEIPMTFCTCFVGGPCQINAQAPGVLPGSNATVEVQRYVDVNGFTLEATSQKFTVPVQSVAPVVFSFPKDDKNLEISELPVMQISDRAYQLITRVNPIKGGETVVLYTSGFGLTSPQIPVGEAAGSVYAPVVSQVKTWLKYTAGGNQLFYEANTIAAASPQFPGVTQVNVTLPEVVPDAGSKVFLVVKVGEEVVPDLELPYN